MGATRVAERSETRPPEPDRQAESRENGHGESVRTGALVGLLTIAIFLTLYIGSVFFLPLMLAVIFDMLLMPVNRRLLRWHIPEPAGAAIIVLLLITALVVGAYALTGPARDWAAQAPEQIQKARDKLQGLTRRVEAMKQTAQQMQDAASGAGGDSGQAAGGTPVQGSQRGRPQAGGRPQSGSGAPQTVVVRSDNSGLFARIFGTTQVFLTGLFEMIVLLYFLLAAGSLFTQKVVKVLPRLRDKKKAVEIARAVEGSVSHYLFTIAIINVVEGAIVAVAMWAIGLPNPPLWGALTALFIFVPYLGALTMSVILFIVAITTFDSVGRALLAPGIFYFVDIIQANFVSPHVLGQRLELNPVAIFVSIMLWGHIWGVPGVFMAVPLAVMLKIFCDHVESLNSLAEFLGK